MRIGYTSFDASVAGWPHRAINASGVRVATACSWRLSRAFLAHSAARVAKVTTAISPKIVPPALSQILFVRFRNAVKSAKDEYAPVLVMCGQAAADVAGVCFENCAVCSASEDSGCFVVSAGL